MFNVVILSLDWGKATQVAMPLVRFFEYTEPALITHFGKDGTPNLEQLTALPCLFMNEGKNDEAAYVGQATRAHLVGNEVVFEPALDVEIPPLVNRMIYAERAALDMPHEFEFSRNHWAVKNVDLYRFLLRKGRPRRQLPSVFQIGVHEQIEPTLVSAMMPFDGSFADVYGSIQLAAKNVGLQCRRADDIWENAAIIQDVVSLIDHSRIVVCDCTGRNPNVFYEIGIAHTLGREVILITQSKDDVPFDLRHLRFIPYLNNSEGRAALETTLRARMETILGH